MQRIFETGQPVTKDRLIINSRTEHWGSLLKDTPVMTKGIDARYAKLVMRAVEHNQR